MPEKSSHHTIDLSLSRARAGGRPYLGDVEAVTTMLRLFAHGSMEHLCQASAGKMTTSEGLALDYKEAFRLADVFLGKCPEMVNGMPGWNCPGAIDAFVAKATAMDTTLPEDRLVRLFQYVVEKAHEACHFADENPADPDWSDIVDDAVVFAAHLLIGIQLPDEVAETLAVQEEHERSKGDATE